MRWAHHRNRPEPSPDEVEQIIDSDVALAGRLDPGLRPRHREMTSALIASKHWEAVGDLELTVPIIVTVAANATIAVLGLDLSLYRHVHSIIVRPSAATSTGRRSGPVPGVISDTPMSTIGQAMPQSGPVAIAWDAALADSKNPNRGRNVVIHELAHKIDMSDGYSDGTPPLRGAALSRWGEILDDEYGRAEGRSSDAVLGGYAWTNPAEFFAVATEAFFCTPAVLRNAKPALYEALAGFYHQDPADQR